MPEETGQFGQMVECSFTDQVALGLSPVAVSIVFDWKENTSIEEEEGKVILDLLSVIYDFQEKKKAFLSSFSCFSFPKLRKYIGKLHTFLFHFFISNIDRYFRGNY